jgi:hypothetical protein
MLGNGGPRNRAAPTRDRRDGVVERRDAVVVAGRKTKAKRQVERRKRQAVYARNSRDLIDVAKALPRFRS